MLEILRFQIHLGQHFGHGGVVFGGDGAIDRHAAVNGLGKRRFFDRGDFVLPGGVADSLADQARTFAITVGAGMV